MLNNLSHLRALWRIFLFLAVTVVLMPLQMIWLLQTLFNNGYLKHQSPMVRWWYRFMVWVLNIEVNLINKPHLDKSQKIFLSNHISYIDILILGAYLDCFFVAKSDIADWPVFGFLAKVSGTIFISRQRRFIKEQLVLLKKHLSAGQSLLIFPEGTTGNGSEILPFKSSLLNVAFTAENPPVIQPLSVVYTTLNQEKITTQERMDLIAWYGEMTLGPHFWNLFRQKSIAANVILHQPIAVQEDLNSKSITLQAHESVASGFYAAAPARSAL